MVLLTFSLSNLTQLLYKQESCSLLGLTVGAAIDVPDDAALTDMRLLVVTTA